MGGTSEIPHLRLWSCQELWLRSWHGWVLEQSFLVWNLFYNDIFVDVLFRRLDRREKVVACFAVCCSVLRCVAVCCSVSVACFAQYKHACTERSLAVSLLCLVRYSVRLACSPTSWPRQAISPVQIRWSSYVSFPLSSERWSFLIIQKRWLWAFCSVFTGANKTDVLVALYGGEAVWRCPRNGQLRMPDKKELPDEKKMLEPHASWGCVNADWTGDTDTRQSHTGHILMIHQSHTS